MPDGLWTSGEAQEVIRQARLVRHRPLQVSLTSTLVDGDASGLASDDPNLIAPGTTSTRGLEGGPHFVLSPETPDGRPTLGFEWCLLNRGALPLVAGWTVTIWVLLTCTTPPGGAAVPDWVAFEPLTGVGFRELFHTFDTNATAIRFQIANRDAGVPSDSIMIVLSEL